MNDLSQPSQPTLPIRRIVQGKNPRTYFDPDKMAELEEGIRAVGVLEPIVVRPIPGTDRYVIIAGERRCRAAKNVFGDGYDMPVVIKDASDETAEAMSVIENYHREDMSPPRKPMRPSASSCASAATRRKPPASWAGRPTCWSGGWRCWPVRLPCCRR